MRYLKNFVRFGICAGEGIDGFSGYIANQCTCWIFNFFYHSAIPIQSLFFEFVYARGTTTQ